MWEVKGDDEKHLGQCPAQNKSIVNVSWFITITRHKCVVFQVRGGLSQHPEAPTPSEDWAQGLLCHGGKLSADGEGEWGCPAKLGCHGPQGQTQVVLGLLIA